MNFPPKTEADLGLFAVVIILFAIAAFLLIWQLVDHKDVKEDMNDGGLSIPSEDALTFKGATPESYEGSKGDLYKFDEIGQYDTPIPTTGFAIHIKGKRFFSTKSEDMSDQAVIPIMHWESVKNKQWYWRISSSSNGLILARGSEGYSSEQKCLQGLRATVQEILRASGVVTQEPVHDMSKRVSDPNA